MKRIILILLFMYCNSSVFSQGRNNLFMFGYNQNGNTPSDMNFQSGVPIVSSAVRPMNLNLSFANITDSLGNLLFYTNGIYIADASNNKMMNGGGLNPSGITTSCSQIGLRLSQADMIIPKPASSNIYYLFHCTWDDGFSSIDAARYFYLTTIDMNGNGGLGEVINKNFILKTDTFTGGTITACKHANGRDWWVVVPGYPHPCYYVFLVTPDTILFSSKQTIGVRTISWGQMCFSKGGTKFCSYDATTDIEIFDFDRCTGTFSNPLFIPVNDGQNGFGCAFSSDATKFYASSWRDLYQVDLNATNIAGSLDTVAQWDSSLGLPNQTRFLMQQLAPDDKIYVTALFPDNYLSVIDLPNNAGISCNVIQQGITLPGLNDQTLPNHPNYFLGPVTGSICDSLSTGLSPKDKTPMDVKLSPNPANAEVYVLYDFAYEKNGKVEIYNAWGKMIFSQKLFWSGKQLQIHTQNFANGIYEVRVSDTLGRSGSKKLVITH